MNIYTANALLILAYYQHLFEWLGQSHDSPKQSGCMTKLAGEGCSYNHKYCFLLFVSMPTDFCDKTPSYIQFHTIGHSDDIPEIISLSKKFILIGQKSADDKDHTQRASELIIRFIVNTMYASSGSTRVIQ